MTRPIALRWLIAYDITDPRRLRRVHRRLARDALFVQRSVAMADLTRPALVALLQALGLLLGDGDDVRAYRVPDDAAFLALGVPAAPGLINDPS